MTEKTAGRLLKSPEVGKYFSKVERNKRKVDFWFHPEPVAVTVSKDAVEEAPETPRQSPVPSQTVTTTVSDGNEYRPSTSYLPTSTSTSDSADASSPNLKDDRLGKGRYECIITSPLNLQTTPEPVYFLDLAAMTTPEPETVMSTVSEFEGRTAAEWREIRKQRSLTSEENEFINQRATAYNQSRRMETVPRIDESW